MATEAGVQFANKLLGPVANMLAAPAGLLLANRGINMRNATLSAADSMQAAEDVSDEFVGKFGRETLRDYKKFDPASDTYKQWRLLRKKNFLEPYIQAGVQGLNMPIGHRTYAADTIRLMRKLRGKWGDAQKRHYDAFSAGPRNALEVLALEGMEETEARNLTSTLDDLLREYDLLSTEHGPYRAFYRLYQQPWAKVNLADQKSVDEFVKKYGRGAMTDAKRRQALLFYASKSKLFAAKEYNKYSRIASLTGLGMQAAGFGLAGLTGYRGAKGMAELLKRGEAIKAGKKTEVPVIPVAELAPAEVAPATPSPATAVTDLIAGANPFSLHADTLGVVYKPQSKTEELARLAPIVAGKGLVGAVVVPSLVRGGVEAIRGATGQGPYAKLPRLRGTGAGFLLGLGLPVKALVSAIKTQSGLKALAAGKSLSPDKLKALSVALKDAPLRSSEFASKAIPSLSAGKSIPASIASGAKKDLFEQNVTTMLNAVLGGGITGYAGYAAYRRSRGIRDAFEKMYGVELPPDVAQAIMDPEKLRLVTKYRRARSMLEQSRGRPNRGDMRGAAK